MTESCVSYSNKMSHEDRGQDGRSILGMLTVQVEKDPKTGATIVKSVAPISSLAGAPTSTTIFDDGRMSIHTVGSLVGEPSTEEVGEILNVINDVGMTVLLDEVAATPNKTEMTTKKVDKTHNDNMLSFITDNGTSKNECTQLDCSGEEPERLKQRVNVKNPDHEIKVVTKDATETLESMEGKSLEEDPVTLVFLGYTDASPEDDQNQEDYEGMLTAERVIITEDGEEHVVEQGTSASFQSPLPKKIEQEAEKRNQDPTLNDVPLDHHEVEPEIQTKQNKCLCCSVM